MARRVSSTVTSYLPVKSIAFPSSILILGVLLVAAAGCGDCGGIVRSDGGLKALAVCGQFATETPTPTPTPTPRGG